jgi:integrase
MIPHHIRQYPKNPGPKDKVYLQVSYKLSPSTPWKQKQVPENIARTIDQIDKAEVWFSSVFCASPEGSAAKTMAMLFPIWCNLTEVQEQSTFQTRRRNLINHIIGDPKKGIAPDPIAEMDLEAPDNQVVDLYISFVKSLHKKGLAPYTVRNIVHTAKSFIDDLGEKQLISYKEPQSLFTGERVMKHIRPEGSKKVGKSYGEDTITLELDQLQKLLSATSYPSQRRLRYFLAASSGLRASELAALRFSSVFLEDATPHLRVSRQLRRGATTTEDASFKETKTEGSLRTLPLHHVLVSLLQGWKEIGWSLLVGRQPEANDLIFCRDDASPERTARYAEIFRNDLKASGLSETYLLSNEESHNFDYHSLRRTFTSLLEEEGIPKEMRQGLLGHTSRDTEGKHYSSKKVSPKKLARLKEAIDKLPLLPEASPEKVDAAAEE